MRLHDFGCGGANDAMDARSVADKLGIPHHLFSFQPEFDQHVIRRFVSAYENGLTPNPCILCNGHMKFGVMLEKALHMGFDYVVSGHYARVRQDESSGRYLLYKAEDRSKDQTYFLASLNQQQLSHILFPLGELTKAEVRKIAEDAGLINARKRDSQDICFVPDGDYAAFLQRYTGKSYPEGDFLNLEGKVVGKHKGAACYTRGQRKGLGLALGAPVYVCRKDMQANTVTVGPNEALFSSALRANNWNWFPFPELNQPMTVTAKIRHSQTELPATVYPEENGFARVEFEESQRAITPGQAVVLYNGDYVVGGGTITDVL
jgi:tRNA-specific 2-thiouridylase